MTRRSIIWLASVVSASLTHASSSSSSSSSSNTTSSSSPRSHSLRRGGIDGRASTRSLRRGSPSRDRRALTAWTPPSYACSPSRGCAPSTHQCLSNPNHPQKSTDDACRACQQDQQYWPCDVDGLCYCRDLSRPAIPPAPSTGRPKSQIDPCSLLTEERFERLAPEHAFPYSYEGFCRAVEEYNANHVEEGVFNAGGELEQRHELAAFLGNALHESDEFQAGREYLMCADKVELGGETYCKPCDAAAFDWDNMTCPASLASDGRPFNGYCQSNLLPPDGCTCDDVYERSGGDGGENHPLAGYVAANQVYFGRGSIQLSWNYNYIRASVALTGAPQTFCQRPDLVATKEEYAWGAGLFFWMENVKNDRTCHQAVLMDGDFGGTLDVINGGLECPADSHGWHGKAVVLRLNRYCRAAKVLELDRLLSLDGCLDMGRKMDECLETGQCPDCRAFAGKIGRENEEEAEKDVQEEEEEGKKGKKKDKKDKQKQAQLQQEQEIEQEKETKHEKETQQESSKRPNKPADQGDVPTQLELESDRPADPQPLQDGDLPPNTVTLSTAAAIQATDEPATTPPEEPTVDLSRARGPCSGDPCPLPNALPADPDANANATSPFQLCRNSRGICGAGPAYCNALSTWTPFCRDCSADDSSPRGCPTFGCDDCRADSQRCVGNRNAINPIDDDACAACAAGQTYWPCDVQGSEGCWCWDTDLPRVEPSPPSGLPHYNTSDIHTVTIGRGVCGYDDDDDDNDHVLFSLATFRRLAPHATHPFTYRGFCEAIDDYNSRHAEKVFLMGPRQRRLDELAAFLGSASHDTDAFRTAREYLACGDRVEGTTDRDGEGTTNNNDMELFCMPCAPDHYDYATHTCALSMLDNDQSYYGYCQPFTSPPDGCPCDYVKEVESSGPLEGRMRANDIFFGRGSIHLSHNFNYIRASTTMTGSEDTFCAQPELLATVESWAWGVGIYIWMEFMTKEEKGMTSHVHALNGNFGKIVNILNGGSECPVKDDDPWYTQAVINRLNHYCHAAKVVGVSQLLDMSGCDGMETLFQTCMTDGTCPNCQYWDPDHVRTESPTASPVELEVMATAATTTEATEGAGSAAATESAVYGTIVATSAMGATTSIATTTESVATTGLATTVGATTASASTTGSTVGITTTEVVTTTDAATTTMEPVDTTTSTSTSTSTAFVTLPSTTTSETVDVTSTTLPEASTSTTATTTTTTTTSTAASTTTSSHAVTRPQRPYGGGANPQPTKLPTPNPSLETVALPSDPLAANSFAAARPLRPYGGSPSSASQFALSHSKARGPGAASGFAEGYQARSEPESTITTTTAATTTATITSTAPETTETSEHLEILAKESNLGTMTNWANTELEPRPNTDPSIVPNAAKEDEDEKPEEVVNISEVFRPKNEADELDEKDTSEAATKPASKEMNAPNEETEEAEETVIDSEVTRPASNVERPKTEDQDVPSEMSGSSVTHQKEDKENKEDSSKPKSSEELLEKESSEPYDPVDNPVAVSSSIVLGQEGEEAQSLPDSVEDKSTDVSLNEPSSNHVTKLGDNSFIFTPLDDTTISRDEPNTNFGSSSSLLVSKMDGDIALFRFDLSAIGEDPSIDKAVLRLTIPNIDGVTAGIYYVQPTQTDWTEDSVTYDTAPKSTGTLFASVASRGDSSNHVELDVSSIIANDIVSFRLIGTDQVLSEFSSKDGVGGNAPMILVKLASPKENNDTGVASSKQAADGSGGTSSVVNVSGSPEGEISGVVWLDKNNDGVRNNGEPGLRGILVDLYFCGSDEWVEGGRTGAAGEYIFENLQDGEYYVKVTSDVNYQIISKKRNSTVDPATGRGECVELSSSGKQSATVNAGIMKVDGDAHSNVATEEATSPSSSPNSIPAISFVTVSESTSSPTSSFDYNCRGIPCTEGDGTWCRSKYNFCGAGEEYCNAESQWMPECGTKSPTVHPTDVPTTGQPTVVFDLEINCSGEPCEEGDGSWCRSELGFCGNGFLYCNSNSMWVPLCDGTTDPTAAPKTLSEVAAILDSMPLHEQEDVNNELQPSSVPTLLPTKIEVEKPTKDEGFSDYALPTLSQVTSPKEIDPSKLGYQHVSTTSDASIADDEAETSSSTKSSHSDKNQDNKSDESNPSEQGHDQADWYVRFADIQPIRRNNAFRSLHRNLCYYIIPTIVLVFRFL